MEKKFTFKSSDGCKRILALCILLVFLGTCFARLINSDFGKIKIEQYKIDARGATIDGEMFYPAGTNSDDKLPCSSRRMMSSGRDPLVNTMFWNMRVP